MSPEWLKHYEERARRGRNQKSFEAFDPDLIAGMSDKELPAWSTQHDADSPQRTLAMFEWQRRLNKQLVEGTLKGAMLGGRSAIIGALLGALLTWFGSLYCTKQEHVAEQKTSRQSTGNKDQAILPKSTLSVDQPALPKAGENKQ